MGSMRHYRARDSKNGNRDNRVNLRFNDTEYALVLKKANKAGKPVTSYVAETMLALARNKNINI